MRSTEFLKEDITTRIIEIKNKYNLSPRMIEFCMDVRRDCQPYLQANPDPIFGDPLFRGIRTEKEFVDEPTKIKTGRDPVNSPAIIHQEANVYFIDKFKQPFRNALFCTGNDIEATGYGAEFIIFPKGDFQFIWSPVISDFFTAYEDFGEAYKKTPNYSASDLQHDFVEAIIIGKGKYTSKNLLAAIRSGHEIMISCDSYHGFNDYNLYEPNGKYKVYGMEEIIKL